MLPSQNRSALPSGAIVIHTNIITAKFLSLMIELLTFDLDSGVCHNTRKLYTIPVDQGDSVETVTISPKYQVVIPSRLRKRLGVKPGQKVKVILYDNRIEMIPVRPVQEASGFLKGIDTVVDRESDRL